MVPGQARYVDGRGRYYRDPSSPSGTVARSLLDFYDSDRETVIIDIKGNASI